MKKSLPEQFFHVTPLHYAPFLLATGAIYSQAELRRLQLPIAPRPSAAKRDRKLGLDRYVHLSFTPITPLLRDKWEKGYPHVLLGFEESLAYETGSVFVRYNAKAWRHREDFFPIVSPAEKEVFLHEWQEGKYPSAELLIPNALPLHPHAQHLYFWTLAEKEWLTHLLNRLNIPLPLDCALWESEDSAPLLTLPSDFTDYATACQRAGKLLPPPTLPFD